MSDTLENLVPTEMQCADFSCAIGWNQGAAWTIAGGNANFANPGAGPAQSQLDHAYAFQAGYLYAITFTIVDWSFTNPSPDSDLLIKVNGVLIGSVNGNGTFTVVHKTIAGDNSFEFVQKFDFNTDEMKITEMTMQDGSSLLVDDYLMFLKYGTVINITRPTATRNTYAFNNRTLGYRCLVGLDTDEF